MGKATNVKFGRYIHRVHPNKSPLKIWENRERGRIQGFPKFLKYPLLSQEWVKLRTSNFTDIFRGSMRTKANEKFVRKWSVGVFRDSPNFLSTPIISRTGKATNFKFCTHILSIDLKSKQKSTKNFWTSRRVRSEDSQNFSGHPYIARIARSSLR